MGSMDVRAAMPGGDLLFHRLSDSTIGAEGFHVRVRDGIGWFTDAMATRQWSLHICPARFLAGRIWFKIDALIYWLDVITRIQRCCWGCVLSSANRTISIG